MDETLAGLVIACRAHETGCRREPMPFALLVAAARRDLVAHAGPLFEPDGVVADVIFERASDAINFVDFDAGPGGGAQANEQAHGPAVIGRKVKEGRVVFAADHVLLLVRDERAEAVVSRARRSTKRSGVVRRRPGIVSLCGGPGSEVHRCALHRIRDVSYITPA